MSTWSSRDAIEIDVDDQAEQEPRQQYLGTIDGCPLLWDHLAHGPWWPEGEPQIVTYEAHGGIVIDPRCDVHRLPRWIIQPKTLDCGHGVRGSEIYVTFLASNRDVCVSCAMEDRPCTAG